MHNQIVEPGVLEGVVGADSELWAELQHALKQVDARRVDGGQDIAEILRRVHLEGRLIFGKLRDARPCTLGRGAHDAEYSNDLIFVCGAREQRSTGVHFGHDTASRPDIDTRVVGAAT